MNAVDYLYIVLYWINALVIIFVTISFLPQGLFYLFFFIRRRHWKPAKKEHEIAILIAAHNESSVIGTTVHFLMNDLDYPREKYKVYVCAHNCTDDTAKKAREAGAIVYELNDPDPRHDKPAYPLIYGFQHILKDNKTAELFVRFDADNIPCKSFLKEMNNSFDAGALIIRAYEAASNLKQNIWTKECALFYTKDSRVQNTFRQFCHATAMTTGPGLSIGRSVLEKINGWDCLTGCEDAEFAWRRLFDGYKCYFNTDAIVYEDQPSSYVDTRKRLTRLGSTLNRMYFTDGWRMLVLFLRTGNPMYLDMLIAVSFNPVSVLCFTWFPLYYASWAILMLLQMNGIHVFSMGYFTYLSDLINTCHFFFGADYAIPAYRGMINLHESVGMYSQFDQLNILGYNALISLLDMAWQVILEMSAFCIWQSFIALFLDGRKLGLGYSLKGMWDAILFSPFYSLIYGVCNCLGAISNPHWAVAKRNPSEVHILAPMPEKSSNRVYFVPSHWDLTHYQGDWWKKKTQGKAESKSR
jgi:cellulose synthase/poly-beta-1,6-N-acetylglucosamine synthase-like glycosyltransferase